MDEAIKEKLISVCEGNPGALSVLVQLVSLSPEFIDYLDEHGPKGSALWTLYKDRCDEDILRTALDLAERMEKVPT